jgi:ubiquinol-cytochrome c reductase cytochrome c1 subunit
MRKLLLSAAAAMMLFSGSAFASGGTPKAPAQKWSFSGIFGTYDRAQLRRGFQVYSEVCAACHSLNLVAYRNLMDIGFSEADVKAIAAEQDFKDGPNDEGEMFERKGKPSDRFKSPFDNAKAAQASNNGANPPDLSLMAKARLHGPDYIYGLLTGYKETPPKGVTLPEGMNYNTYFPGHQIAMAPPLSDEAVEYKDGTKPTLDQHARDTVVFLAWAASPEMEERKRMGIKVLLFLLVLTGMLFALKKKIWSDLH